jgi:ribosomal protein S18 acetylase RimI-like enzyme
VRAQISQLERVPGVVAAGDADHLRGQIHAVRRQAVGGHVRRQPAGAATDIGHVGAVPAAADQLAEQAQHGALDGHPVEAVGEPLDVQLSEDVVSVSQLARLGVHSDNLSTAPDRLRSKAGMAHRYIRPAGDDHLAGVAASRHPRPPLLLSDGRRRGTVPAAYSCAPLHGYAHVMAPPDGTTFAQWAVRPLHADDHARWRELYAGYTAFYALTHTDEQAERTWGWLMDPAHELEGLVALSADARVVGLAHVRAFARPSTATVGGYLDDLYVDPGARGTGAADALLTAVAQHAMRRGWSVVRWITADDNHRARSKYDQHATRTHWITYDMAPAPTGGA